MRILVTGARGMAGSALVPILRQSKIEVLAPEKYQLNIGNVEQVNKYRNEKLDWIVNLAAETDHEFCEQNPAQCYFINTIGTGNMVNLAMKLRIPIIHISAGSIFDGKRISPYLTECQPNPMNHYNMSKWYAETLVKEHILKHYILRAGWMFGGGPGVDKKFVNKLMEKVKRGDKEIKVCDDCFGSPTYNKDLAYKILEIINNPIPSGVYHCVNKEPASRFEFAQSIVNILGLKVKIVPVKIDDLKDEFPCKRTNYEVLQPSFKIRSWRLALREYLYACYRH